MQLAHIGVAVFIVGVTIVTGYQSEQDVRMDIGEQSMPAVTLFASMASSKWPGQTTEAARAEIEVSRNGTVINKMYPEKRTYTAHGNVMTETAIDTGLFRDLYISLGEPVSGGAWSVRVYYKPFVSLDLGRRGADGDGWRPGAQRSPLCAGGAETTRGTARKARRAVPGSRNGGERSMTDL